MLTPEQIDLAIQQHVDPVATYGRLHNFARAIEAEVRKQDDALILQLTDKQLAEMMRDTWGCASIAPRHALEFARAVERAHGITQKGGD